MSKKVCNFAIGFERHGKSQSDWNTRFSLLNETSQGRPGWRNGRRGRLKICCPQGRVGSIPTPGTKRWSFDRRSFFLSNKKQ